MTGVKSVHPIAYIDIHVRLTIINWHLAYILA